MHLSKILVRALAVLPILSLFLSLSSPARADKIIGQSGAQSLLIDPSIRSSAMGNSSNAVFWGSGTNYWSNPALLAYHSGVEYEWGRTQLVPDLADDVFFTTKRLTLGYWGVGFLVAGKPITDVGGSRLSYGVSIATDVDGNELGRFSSYEDTRSFAAGVNVLEFAEHALQVGGMELPALSRFGDVALGWSEKRTHVFLFPADLTQDRLSSEGYVTTHDSGVLVRVTPYDAIDSKGFLRGLDRRAATRLDLSYGGSTQNYNNATISYNDQYADPVLRSQIKGWAIRAALDTPHWMNERVRSHRYGWVVDVISPLLSVAKTGTKQLPMIPDATTGGLRSGTRIERSGWEITLANIYSLRGGHIDDPAGTIQGHTSGWGIGVHLRDLAGFSYDRSTVPQSIYLGPVHRKAFSFYLNPLHAWGMVHGRKHSV